MTFLHLVEVSIEVLGLSLIGCSSLLSSSLGLGLTIPQILLYLLPHLGVCDHYDLALCSHSWVALVAKLLDLLNLACLLLELLAEHLDLSLHLIELCKLLCYLSSLLGLMPLVMILNCSKLLMYAPKQIKLPEAC